MPQGDDRENEAQHAGGAEGGAEGTEGEHRRELERERRRRGGKTIVVLAVILVLILFVLANSQSVRVSFLVVEGRPPLIWVMVGCSVLGGIAGFLLGRPGRGFRFHRGDGGGGRRDQG